MYAEAVELPYEDNIDYEEQERTSDIQLPAIMNFLLLAIWLVICLIGFAVIFLAENPVAGAVLIAIPTVIGMLIKPTFGLCILMLVLPTGAGVGFRQMFSLDRGVGIAVALTFALNLLLTRPGVRVANKALWILVAYTFWIFLASLFSPYLSQELRRAFTQFQLLALVFIVYWILQSNTEKTLIWALRSYVVGSIGTIVLTYLTGTAIRSMEEAEGRYAATLGQAIDANMLAALASLAFLSAIYLFARDKNIFWRIIYLAAILFLPVMLLRIASRGAIVAIAFTMLSPLLFVRQVLRRPALAVLVLTTILLGSVSAGLIVKRSGLETDAAGRLTDIPRAKTALSYRMVPIKQAVKVAVRRPTGTSYYGWFERAGTRHWPHNDFFLALGAYGIPAALLFAIFAIILMFTVRRMHLGWEKLYARAVLTFLLVNGLSIGQLYHKHFWVFLAVVVAMERISYLKSAQTENLAEESVEDEIEEFEHQSYAL